MDRGYANFTSIPRRCYCAEKDDIFITININEGAFDW
jgi:hypothetical protein